MRDEEDPPVGLDAAALETVQVAQNHILHTDTATKKNPVKKKTRYFSIPTCRHDAVVH